MGWRKVTCWETDMPLKGLPSLKKWCQPGPARLPSSLLPLAIQPSEVRMGPQRPQPVVPHRTPTQACSCTPRDQRYTKETALKSMATRAPGENWFSQSTGGGGTSLGVTQPKVTRPPALRNHSLEQGQRNTRGTQLDPNWYSDPIRWKTRGVQFHL